MIVINKGHRNHLCGLAKSSCKAVSSPSLHCHLSIIVINYCHRNHNDNHLCGLPESSCKAI